MYEERSNEVQSRLTEKDRIADEIDALKEDRKTNTGKQAGRQSGRRRGADESILLILLSIPSLFSSLFDFSLFLLSVRTVHQDIQAASQREVEKEEERRLKDAELLASTEV